MKLSGGTSWVFVPRVATEEMFYAAIDDDGIFDINGLTNAIAAAPQPPVEEMIKWLEPWIADVVGDEELSTIDCARAIVKRLVGKESY